MCELSQIGVGRQRTRGGAIGPGLVWSIIIIIFFFIIFFFFFIINIIIIDIMNISVSAEVLIKQPKECPEETEIICGGRKQKQAIMVLLYVWDVETWCSSQAGDHLVWPVVLRHPGRPPLTVQSGRVGVLVRGLDCGPPHDVRQRLLGGGTGRVTK